MPTLLQYLPPVLPPVLPLVLPPVLPPVPPPVLPHSLPLAFPPSRTPCFSLSLRLAIRQHVPQDPTRKAEQIRLQVGPNLFERDLRLPLRGVLTESYRPFDEHHRRYVRTVYGYILRT